MQSEVTMKQASITFEQPLLRNATNFVNLGLNKMIYFVKVMFK